ncbi:MAG: serine/threonine protein kinase [bacterium]|nr:serine/threonine protein kinase [bacterium]
MQEPHSDEDTRVLEILERYFLAEGEGAAPDLNELCEGNPELQARVRRLLASEHEAVRSALQRDSAETADAPFGRLGDYRIVRRLGRGGMGTVYLAEQESLGRLIALKVLDERALVDSNARIRFKREAEVAAALDHPNIVPVYGIGEEDGYAFIAMKLLSGPSLDELHPRHEGRISPRVVARIGMDVARGLDAAHLHGVVHRDVKPANVLLDGEVPTIVDFGLARSASDRSLTRTGAVPGTLPYMAPELLSTDSRELDPRIDVYSLGATLYEMITGRPPFDADDTQHMMAAILIKDPPPLRLPAVHRDVETIIMRALEKEPHRRFPTAAAMADDLARYLEGLPILSRRSGFISRSWKLARRHRKAATLISATAVVALGFGSIVIAQEMRSERRFRANFDAAAAKLAAGELVAARTDLELLEHTFPGRAGVAAAHAECDGRLALEELLDAVIVRPITASRNELDACEKRLEGTQWAHRNARAAELALAFADHHQNDVAGARTHVAAAEVWGASPRAVEAIRRMIEGGSFASLPNAQATADELLLVSAAKRITGEPLASQEADLLRATRVDRFHDRTLFTHAIALATAGDSREAELILRGLVDHHRMPSMVWEALAVVAKDMGDAAGIRTALSHLPEHRETVYGFHLLLAAAWRDGLDGLGWHDVLRLLDERPDLADEPFVARVRATYELVVLGDVEAGLATLEAVQVDGIPTEHHEHVEALICGVHSKRLPVRGKVALSDVDQDRHRALIARIDRNLDLFRDRRVRAILLYLRALSLYSTEEPLRAVEDLVAAHELPPVEPEVTIRFAELVLNLPSSCPANVRYKYRLAATRAVVELLRRLDRRETKLLPGVHRDPGELLEYLIR